MDDIKGTTDCRAGKRHRDYRRKYVCPSCGRKVWATSDLRVICGYCMLEMVLQTNNNGTVKKQESNILQYGTSDNVDANRLELINSLDGLPEEMNSADFLKLIS